MVVFVRVAEERSFSRAAAVLYLAQPPVSQRIAALEMELGATPFVRSSRGVTLTEAGQRFLPYVERCLALAEESQDVVRAARSIRRLRMAAPASIASPTSSQSSCLNCPLGVSKSIAR